jgi:hypothetical protein
LPELFRLNKDGCMKKFTTVVVAIACCFSLVTPAHARSVRHHLINAGEKLGEAAGAPLHALVVEGPRNIRDAWNYETHGEQDRKNRLLNIVIALWRAPGEQIKAVVNGIGRSVSAASEMTVELLSIPFSD